MRMWLVVALAACSGKATKPSGPVTAGSAVKPAPACVVPPVEEAAPINHASTAGTRVAYCVGKGAQCFSLDVATGAFERVELPKPADDMHAHVETTDPRLAVCTGTRCKPMTSNVLPNATTIRAATNREGTFAVILLGDAPKGRGYAEVWDVTKTRRAATFRYANGDYRCGDVAMLDDRTIYVSASQCGQPAARGTLYSVDGRRIANVGGKDFGTFGGVHVQVDGSTWAFLEENGNKLAIQDIAKGKVLKVIDTSILFKDGGAEMGNPGESALVRFADGKLGIVAGAPATGSVATVDVVTGEIAIVPAPLCKNGV